MTILYGMRGQREKWLEDIDDIPTNTIPERKEQIDPGTIFCNHKNPNKKKLKESSKKS